MEWLEKAIDLMETMEELRAHKVLDVTGEYVQLSRDEFERLFPVFPVEGCSRELIDGDWHVSARYRGAEIVAVFPEDYFEGEDEEDA